jgi:hypothetical protein
MLPRKLSHNFNVVLFSFFSCAFSSPHTTLSPSSSTWTDSQRAELVSVPISPPLFPVVFLPLTTLFRLRIGRIDRAELVPVFLTSLPPVMEAKLLETAKPGTPAHIPFKS